MGAHDMSLLKNKLQQQKISAVEYEFLVAQERRAQQLDHEFHCQAAPRPMSPAEAYRSAKLKARFALESDSDSFRSTSTGESWSTESSWDTVASARGRFVPRLLPAQTDSLKSPISSFGSGSSGNACSSMWLHSSTFPSETHRLNATCTSRLQMPSHRSIATTM